MGTLFKSLDELIKYPIFALYFYENSPINPYIFKKVIPIFPLYFIQSLLEALLSGLSLNTVASHMILAHFLRLSRGEKDDVT